MDIKHVLSRNPLHPSYLAGAPEPAGVGPPKAGWLRAHWRSRRDRASRQRVRGSTTSFPCIRCYLTPFGLADRP